jgi:hypothetical protein
MVAQNTHEKLPARLAWPLIVVNVFGAIIGVFMVISHSHGPWSSWLGIILAIAEICVCVPVFLWLRRRGSSCSHPNGGNDFALHQ